MLSPITGTPLYMNKSMILDLSAVLIDGYIDNTTVRYTASLTGDKKIASDCKVQKTTEDKLTNTTTDDSTIIDGKADIRGDFSNKKLFTTFFFFNSVREALVERNSLKYITEKDIVNNSIKCGEYIEFSSNLTTSGLIPTISAIIDILECYDTKVLDNLLKDKISGYTNYTVILKQLKILYNYLSKNNTTDLIMSFNSAKAILDININNFCDKNAYTYDTADTECKTLGKIIRIVDETSSIDLLRKTCMSCYYNKFLISILPYLKILSDNGILVPYNLFTTVTGPAIQVIPIAMYI